MQLRRELALQSWDAVHRDQPWICDLTRARNRVERAILAGPLVADDDDQAQQQYVVARHAVDVPHFSRTIWPPTCWGQCFADRGGSGGTVGRRRSSPAAAEICSIWATTCSRCRRLVIQLR